MSGLFSTMKFKDMELKNRIVMPPMCMYSAVDGNVSPWHVVHYATRAMGGAGLIILEATAVSQEGRISSSDLGIWSDDKIEGLRTVVERVHASGAKIGIQLAHAGRKAGVGGIDGMRILAPSAIRFDEDSDVPAEITQEEITQTAGKFGQAAKRALMAGFDVVEIHGAHGYLISEFLSPLCNHRTDAYGGSPVNRSRFLREVVAEVRKEWPAEKPLILRVSAADYADGGNAPEDIAAMINTAKDLGIDLVHVSSGGVVPVSFSIYPGYQLELSRTVRTDTGLPTIAGGLVTHAAMADEIIRNGRGDLVFVGRELLRNPYWPLQAARELRVEVEWPEQYLRGKPSV